MNNDIQRPDDSLFNQPPQRPDIIDSGRRVARPVDSFVRRPDNPQRPVSPNHVPMPQRPPQPQPQFQHRPQVQHQSHTPAQNNLYAQNTAPAMPAAPPQQPMHDMRPHNPQAQPANYGAQARSQEIPQASNDFRAPPVRRVNKLAMPLKIFGGLMIVLSVLSAALWVSIGVKNIYEELSLVLSVAALALAAAMLMKQKKVRQVFLVVSAVLLVLTFYGTYDHFNQVSKYNNSKSSSLVGLESAIQKYQNDTSISATQRTQYIAALQKSEVVERGKLFKIQLPLSIVVLEYLVALMPLVVLTRPAIVHALGPKHVTHASTR